MIKLGLDFDNTLIDYDEVFYEIACEKNLIPKNIGKTKVKVRKFLKDKGEEELFTLLQGEVYGSKINLAKQSEGMFETLKILKEQNIELFIVSHKTLYPYAGPKFD
ncbi:HAD family hydrolase, partial [Prochlorococcus sp. AH-736-F09]|nr:HAD family hydrolase [Prochlorococcus sp. AH-736-F09]